MEILEDFIVYFDLAVSIKEPNFGILSLKFFPLKPLIFKSKLDVSNIHSMFSFGRSFRPSPNDNR